MLFYPLSAFKRSFAQKKGTLCARLHLDPLLLLGLLLLQTLSFLLLYSAGDKNPALLTHQLIHCLIAYGALLLAAQIPPHFYARWAPRIFAVSLALLLGVLLLGVIGKGAQRWLYLGGIRFEPSELMKLTMPLMLAWFLKEKQLPPTSWTLLQCALLILIPALLIAKQPDLGTALMITMTGALVLLLAGTPWRTFLYTFGAGLISLPILWRFMHDYQRERVLTFLNPQRDPLGTGYHIIQSKIALGSGGFLGKGWLHGTQSHLRFLPEHTTDFIFSVWGEELGFIGVLALMGLFAFIIGRCLVITAQAQTTFTRLLAGGLTLTFFMAMFINIGMVCGILPVVGLPLPLMSYGGTTLTITLTSFGILMSVHAHRKLLAS